MIFPTQMELDNLILKKPLTEFAGQVADLVLRNQEEFKFIPWTRGYTTVSKAEENLKSMAEKWEKLSITYFIFKAEKLIGYAGLHVRDAKQVAEISYYLDKDYTGHGYITEVIKKLQQMFFEQGGHRCEIFCNETNKRSCAVAERLNYRLDGTMREYELMDGVYQGVRIYSKLSTD